MPTYLDLDAWPRRELFEFYRDFDKPYFNVCTRLDVTNLLQETRKHPGVSVALTYHYFALKAANDIEQFRYRLRNGRVLVHDVINGGTTLMLPNETFTLVYFDYADTFAEFIGPAQRAIEETKKGWRLSPATRRRRSYSLHHAALDLFHKLFTRAQLATGRFSAEDFVWKVYA